MVSENKLNSLLYRIIKGRLRLSVGGLSLIICEPGSDLIEQSYEIYESVYNEHYMSGDWVEEQLKNHLVDQGLWTPLDDKEIERINKEVEDVKVECFQNFFKPRELTNLKRKLLSKQDSIHEILSRKHALDHLCCEHAAEIARQNWLLSKSCFDKNGELVNWTVINFNKILNFYKENIIDHSVIRKIARSNVWRTIWSSSKKIDLFDRPGVDLTRDQLTLCSYSNMYDSVYESPESPNEKVIEDDDCLDGWFIFQRRKHEKDKKSQETEDLIRNPKIKNSKEVFVMAKSKEDAESINNLNNELSKAIIAQRKNVVQEKGSAKDTDFFDVQTELQMERQQAFINKMKGR
jgi:hypothetical protein